MSIDEGVEADGGQAGRKGPHSAAHVLQVGQLLQLCRGQLAAAAITSLPFLLLLDFHLDALHLLLLVFTVLAVSVLWGRWGRVQFQCFPFCVCDWKPVKQCLLVGCLTPQQHAVSQAGICSDKSTCCHTEIQIADQTYYLIQSQYTDTGPTSPSADPSTPGAWQGSHWSTNFEVTGMTRPGKIPAQVGVEHQFCCSRVGRCIH